MSDHKAPHDVKGFTITTFLSFVVMFVIAMLMMIWRGNYSHDANGTMHYETHVSMPSDGHPDN